MNRFDPLQESVKILSESASRMDEKAIRTMLEDVNSPVRMKYNQKLYEAIINKKHIDFDDIPNSRGDIKMYSGYSNMMETLRILRSMDEFEKTSVVSYVKTIEEAISNIENLREIYTKGFSAKNDYVMLEYNVFVYACVQATTAVLNQFVDYMKTPNADSYKIILRNTKYRADLSYIQSLEKFNNVNRNMLSEYRKFLLAMIDGEKSNFVGSAYVTGSVTIALVAAAIVPVSRELVYQFYNLKRKLSDACLQQAYFLELNKAALESNGSFTAEKRKNILTKQENVRNKLLKISEMLRTDTVQAGDKARRELALDNKKMSVEKLRKEVDESPLELF